MGRSPPQAAPRISRAEGVNVWAPTPLARGLVRKTVDVVNYPDGRFAVQFDGVSLPFRKFDKIRTVEPGEIVENKRLGAGTGNGEAAPGHLRAASASLSLGATACPHSRA